jgi:hypothetical protein
MSVQIINLRTGQPYDFRCDGVSPVGNPFIMHHESARDEVCEQYERLFDQTMHDSTLNDLDVGPLINSNVGKFRAYIQEIVNFHKQHGHVTLACGCAPKKCHCETIRQWILNPW